MKKLLLCLACLVLLCGCSTSSTGYEVKVSEEDKVLLTVDGQKVTKQGYFEHLLNNYGASSIVTEALVKISDLEPQDKAQLDALVNERIELYSSYANKDLEAFAKSMGYASKQDFIDEALVPDAKQELLRNNYIAANFDSLVSEYQVARIKVMIFSKESEALNLIGTIDSMAKFDAAMKDHKDSDDYDIVNKNSYIDSELAKLLPEISKLTTDGVYPKAVKLYDGKYAAVYVYDTAKKDHKEYIDALTIEPALQEVIEGHYLRKYGFNIYDQKLKDAVKALSSSYVE